LPDRSQAARGTRTEQVEPSRFERLRQRHEWLDRLVRAGVRYGNQYGDYYAAAITYFSVLALVPLLMIGFAIAGFVLAGHPVLLDELRGYLTTAVPNLSGVLNNVVDQAIRQAGTVGILGLLIALYSGLGWMTALREALTAQWSQQPATTPFLRRTISDLLSLIGLGLALAISFGISAFGGGLGRLLFELLGIRDTPVGPIALRILTLVLSLIASWLVFLWILARLPRMPVTPRSAVWGALFAAVGFEVLKQVGVIYLNSVTGSPAAAAFGPILGLLVFAYLASRFILFVAAWTASAPENVAAEPTRVPAAAVIRPIVQVSQRTRAGTAMGLLGLGALTAWVLRRR
jgi:membrane protein